MESPLRLVASHPLDELSRTVEALLVVASAPLPVDELAAAADAHPEQVEEALQLVGERFAEDRSGIVLEHVAGGWAFRASRRQAAACARLFERPAQRNLSQAALETLAIVAYLGPCSRPDIARIRGVAAGGCDRSGTDRRPPRACLRAARRAAGPARRGCPDGCSSRRARDPRVRVLGTEVAAVPGSRADERHRPAAL